MALALRVKSLALALLHLALALALMLLALLTSLLGTLSKTQPWIKYRIDRLQV
jgi:hypothetical protein